MVTKTGTKNADQLVGTELDDILYGLEDNDTLIGGNGGDLLIGGTGADTMIGGIGDDHYYVDEKFDVVTENADEGRDSVYAEISYALGANIESLHLMGTKAINGTGNELDNSITGNDASNVLKGGGGNDSLNGGGGIDTLIGGIGDDTYWVDNTGDIVKELADEGIDQVNSWVSYTLGATLERLFLKEGAGNIDGTGNELDNWLRGNEGNNVLKGGGGDDIIVGFGGQDKMAGGMGNDYFVVDSSDDVVVEYWDQGFDDIIYTRASYTMSDNVERMILAESAGNINGYGSNGGNVIFGNESDNTLSGNGGKDSLWGYGGDDLIQGGKGGDVLDGGTGLNTLAYVFSDAGVLVNLGNGMTLGGDAQGDVISNFQNIIGSNFADSLFGDGFANVLNGLGDNDYLYGGLNTDTFKFTANFGHDTVLDFHTAAAVGAGSIEHDIIELDQGMFANFAAIQAAMQQVGDDTVITLNAGNTITLENVLAATLQASDFHLV